MTKEVACDDGKPDRQCKLGDPPENLARSCPAIMATPPANSPAPAHAPDAHTQTFAHPAQRTIVLPDLDWVDIPGGEFRYQQRERRTLGTFRIARYPITNVQYQTFVDAGGYREERWWQDLRRPEPQPSRWPQGNRPRTNVDWYEAVAFARWLSAQLRYEVRLPTEEEWERAAGGPEGREYPWGAEYESGQANIDETARWGSEKVGGWYLGQTAAVGVYPHGASEEGVLDLSGNVWEWCLNQYDYPETIRPDTSRQMRVLRGGSWDGPAASARASLRFAGPSDYRDDDVGFRLVSSAPIV